MRHTADPAKHGDSHRGDKCGWRPVIQQSVQKWPQVSRSRIKSLIFQLIPGGEQSPHGDHLARHQHGTTVETGRLSLEQIIGPAQNCGIDLCIDLRMGISGTDSPGRATGSFREWQQVVKMVRSRTEAATSSVWITARQRRLEFKGEHLDGMQAIAAIP